MLLGRGHAAYLAGQGLVQELKEVQQVARVVLIRDSLQRARKAVVRVSVHVRAVTVNDTLEVAEPLLLVGHHLLAIPEVGGQGSGQVLAVVKDELRAWKERANKVNTLGEHLAQEADVADEWSVDLLETKDSSTRHRVVHQQHQLSHGAQDIALGNIGRSIPARRRRRRYTAARLPSMLELLRARACRTGGRRKLRVRKPSHVDPRIVCLAADAITWDTVEHMEQMGASAPAKCNDKHCTQLFQGVAVLFSVPLPL
eukprot:2833042-Prymnesium_polylepis.1